MPKGTGIATYGRNLASNIRSIGFSPEFLFGPPGSVSADNTVNEAAIADVTARGERMGKAQLYLRTVASRLPRSAFPVRPTSEVIWRNGRAPDADRYWTSPSLYRFAYRAFDRYGAATPVQFKGGVDDPTPSIMHWTATTPLHAKGVPNVYTFHDLIPLRLPHTTTDDVNRYMAMCKLVVRHADHIAVVSEATRQDVISLLGVPEGRVSNTYQSVSLPSDALSRTETEVALEIAGVFDLEWKSYFIHFGAIEPKKNLGRIVNGYFSSGVRSPLIIVGSRAWMSEEETALLDRIIAEDGPGSKRIRHYDYLPFELLISLVRGAKATIFPSLYEGFGLPVLESMLLGTAVLTSTAGALEEIAGTAALTVDPYDTLDIARGIRLLDVDADLRQALVDKGRRQALLFTEAAYQVRLRALYQRVS